MAGTEDHREYSSQGKTARPQLDDVAERDAWETVDGLLARLSLGPHEIRWMAGSGGAMRACATAVSWVGLFEQPPEAPGVGRLLRKTVPEDDLRALLSRIAPGPEEQEPHLRIPIAWHTLLQHGCDHALAAWAPRWAAIVMGLASALRGKVHRHDGFQELRDGRWAELYGSETATLLEDLADGAVAPGSRSLRTLMRSLATPPNWPTSPQERQVLERLMDSYPAFTTLRDAAGSVSAVVKKLRDKGWPIESAKRVGAAARARGQERDLTGKGWRCPPTAWT